MATTKSQFRNAGKKAPWQQQLHHCHWYWQFDVKSHLRNVTFCRHATCEDAAQDFICLPCEYQNPEPSTFTDLTTPSIPSAGFHHLYNAHNKWRQWAAFIYTGCPRRNVPDFRRVFLMLKYTDITQNTYIQIWTITEIMAREKCGLLAVPRTAPVFRRFEWS